MIGVDRVAFRARRLAASLCARFRVEVPLRESKYNNDVGHGPAGPICADVPRAQRTRASTAKKVPSDRVPGSSLYRCNQTPGVVPEGHLFFIS